MATEAAYKHGTSDCRMGHCFEERCRAAVSDYFSLGVWRLADTAVQEHGLARHVRSGCRCRTCRNAHRAAVARRERWQAWLAPAPRQ